MLTTCILCWCPSLLWQPWHVSNLLVLIFRLFHQVFVKAQRSCEIHIALSPPPVASSLKNFQVWKCHWRSFPNKAWAPFTRDIYAHLYQTFCRSLNSQSSAIRTTEKWRLRTGGEITDKSRMGMVLRVLRWILDVPSINRENDIQKLTSQVSCTHSSSFNTACENSEL